LKPNECRKRRKAVGIKLEAFSQLSGIHMGSISRYELRKYVPGARVVEKLERTLIKLEQLKENFGGVSLDFNDVAWIRSEIKKLPKATTPAPPAAEEEAQP